MNLTDPIADYLTRLRNALKARHKIAEIPASGIKKEITKILKENGFIINYKIDPTDNHQGKIVIALKYDKNGNPVINTLKRVSRPGLRKYVGNEELPRVLNGLGIAIISTSRGVITDKIARTEKVGGEVLCYVY